MDIYEQLIRDEGGNRLVPYMDCCHQFYKLCDCRPKGNLTVGPGISIEHGISAAWGFAMFRDRVAQCRAELAERMPWTGALEDVRYAVLVNMVYSMGIGGLLAFKAMLAALRDSQFDAAADELLNSDFGRSFQHARAKRLSDQIRSGVWR
jgi:lysozyme